jgi:hypothetical protein
MVHITKARNPRPDTDNGDEFPVQPDEGDEETR